MKFSYFSTIMAATMALGASVAPSGELVKDLSVENGTIADYPWTVYAAPTQEGSAVTYTSDGKVYVIQGPQIKGSCYGFRVGNVCCIGIYCDLAVTSPSSVSDYTDKGLKAVKLSDDVDKSQIDYITLYADGSVDIQTKSGSAVSKRAVCIGIRAGSCCIGLCCGCVDRIETDEELKAVLAR